MPAAQAHKDSLGLKSPLLEGLQPLDRETILAAGSLKHFRANAVITAQGSPADRLFFLVKGCVRYFHTTPDGKKILMIWLAPGDIFGAAAILSKPFHYVLSTEAVKDSEVLIWERATLRAFTARFPLLLDNAIVIASEYFEWNLNAQVALSCHTARERLASALLGFARAIGEKVPDGVMLDVTNEELANSANITPYTTSRLMSEWQKNRAVVKRRGKLLLRAPGRLVIHPK